MPDPRIEIIKRTSPWGLFSYDALVDGELVGNYRYRADAARAGEERLLRSSMEEGKEEEDFQLEFGE